MTFPGGASLAIVLVAGGAAAQQPAPGSKRPPVRPLGAVVARATDTLGTVASVRQLPGGCVLVNDPVRRRVLLLDSALTTAAVVADSTSATANAYSGRTGGLIPYRGDSTLFVDPTALSMLVIDPAGKIARVMSVPRANDAMALAAGAFGSPGFDPAGRLVYRAPPAIRMHARAPGSAGPATPEIPDSAAIVRVDLVTRQLDTLGFIRTPSVKLHVAQEASGRVTMTSMINPLPVVDEWAVLADGSVALVRGRDYHVDFVGVDGATTAAPRLPFEWQRLSDDDKVAFLDSVKAMRARMPAPTAGNGQQHAVVTSSAGAGAPPPVASPPPGGGGMVMVFTGPGDHRPGGGAPGAAPAAIAPPPLEFVAPSELPDYKPPFFAGSVRADAEGNLWIRTIPTRAIAGGPIYDVVNRRGELIDRVQIPADRQIAGFGAGGTVYLTMREGTTTHLERARVR